MNYFLNTVPHARIGLLASAGIAALAFANPVYAQASSPGLPTVDCPDLDDDGVCDPDESNLSNADTTAEMPNTIVVTGSRIRRDEFSTVEPITVITADEITQGGFASSTDALQSNAVTAGAGQINNYYAGFVTDGGTGANTLGLRGLGPARTLILLNGRRLAPGGTRGSLLAADLNVLPTAIVERIEVLKAGASSVYGSDAVAGVVNIITDDQLRGLHLDLQVNVPEVGAGVTTRAAASFGFQADRLNLIGSFEYTKRGGYRRNQNDWFNCPIAGFLDGEGSEFGSGDYIDPATGEPKCFGLDNGGVTINTLGVSTRNAPDRLTGVIGRFNRLVPDASNVSGPTPGFSGVNLNTRDTFDPVQENEFLITPLEKYTGYLSASYELDALGNAELYADILATRRKSEAVLYRQLSLDYPIYLNDDFTPTGRINPLVPAQFQNSILGFPNQTTGTGFLGARAFIGFGLTDSRQNVDYVRAGGGLRGDLAFVPDWRYDVYVGKSWNDATYEAETFLTDRIAASTDVVLDADGNVVCASQAINPSCVAAPPLNADTIGGRLPQAYRDYILANTIGTTQFRETTFAANIDGPLFTLPAGEVQLALGAEYRKQSINDQPDENSVNGNLYNLTASTPTVGSDSVKEVFGEVFVPLLRDRAFFENLTLNASVRYTDYESYGSDVTYKVAGEWEFFPGVGVRASYGTSYRAPALAEQFLGATSGFLGSGSDPCDSDNFPANPAARTPNEQIIAANCAAVGIDVNTFVQTSGITVLRKGGAETGLAAETSTNWSVGAVVSPPIPQSIGSLTLALDYFDIKVENGVSDLAGGTILNRCYGEANFDPAGGFCRFVDRNTNNQLEVTSSFVNLAEDIVKGFEFNGRFSSDIGPGRFVLNANVTKYTEQSTRLFPEEFLDDANGIVTSPDWVGTFDATYAMDNVTLRYGVDWTDGDRNATYDFFAFDNITGEVDEELVQSFRDIYLLEVDDYFLHSASVQFGQDDYEFTIGVRNLFDTRPPRISAVGFSSVGNAPLYSGYDYAGRTFFANAAYKF
ncbi:TonB-dependent receptor [Altererythrobacter sp. SALINAS58]|uniref:TonB-dependent receptor domain-containing protein n=1 Tax=Alteripontixanthobacter muriae TaxID=2705546 RepID=UPI0015763480|nr:TonB-dependent receptor [Alteripontixanthobacter muriae]NTZ42259.1 TonB-dependent receptor [Alteripontixanthobacter muriae]